MITVRNATLDDAVRIAEIYEYYVNCTAISFEYDAPTPKEIRRRMEKTMERYPYFVVERNGVVEGYAYAGPFVGRPAYGWACETSIYLSHTARKCGMGRALYEVMEKALQKMGVLNVYACIGLPEQDDEYLTRNSANFHAHLGYKQVAQFYKCGYKFDHWYHMIWMEKIIGTHGEKQPQVIPYPDTI